MITENIKKSLFKGMDSENYTKQEMQDDEYMSDRIYTLLEDQEIEVSPEYADILVKEYRNSKN